MSDADGEPSFPPRTTHYLTSATILRLFSPKGFTKKHFDILTTQLDACVDSLDVKTDSYLASSETPDSFPSITHTTSTTRDPKANPTRDDFVVDAKYKDYKKIDERARRAVHTARATGSIDEGIWRQRVLEVRVRWELRDDDDDDEDGERS